MTMNLQAASECKEVNVKDDWEVRYWCLQLNCSERQLRAAVQAVGLNVSEVRRGILKGAGLREVRDVTH